ncbi:MAG: hypothetical protein AB7U43_02290 [Desulfobacter sp.]|jgi:hypothetical protein
MTICILKPCKVRRDAAVLELAAGDFLTLAPGKESRLIETGHARAATAKDYRSMVEQFQTHAPCKGCWSWNQQHQPDLWRQHIQALKADDITTARSTFIQMTTAWSAAQQPA